MCLNSNIMHRLWKITGSIPCKQILHNFSDVINWVACHFSRIFFGPIDHTIVYIVIEEFLFVIALVSTIGARHYASFQMAHLFSGFIGEFTGQLNALANSLEFCNGPFNLKIKQRLQLSFLLVFPLDWLCTNIFRK